MYKIMIHLFVRRKYINYRKIVRYAGVTHKVDVRLYLYKSCMKLERKKQCFFVFAILYATYNTVAGFLFYSKRNLITKKCIEGNFGSWKTALYGRENKSAILFFHEFWCTSVFFAWIICVLNLAINKSLTNLALIRSKIANTRKFMCLHNFTKSFSAWYIISIFPSHLCRVLYRPLSFGQIDFTRIQRPFLQKVLLRFVAAQFVTLFSAKLGVIHRKRVR